MDKRKFNGGAREGSGAKVARHTLQNRMFRAALAERITKEADEWLDAISDSAKGLWVMKETDEGVTRVYKKAPDVAAWEKAMDRAFGKVPVRMTDGENEFEVLPIPILYVPSNNGDQENNEDVQEIAYRTGGNERIEDHINSDVSDSQSTDGQGADNNVSGLGNDSTPEEGGNAGLSEHSPTTPILQG